MLTDVFLYFLVALGFMCLYRVISGPTVADRIVAIDIFGILAVGFCAVIAVRTGRSFYMDVGIAWIILSFIGTITMAKYLGRKKLNE